MRANYLVNGVAGFGSIGLAKAGTLDWQAYYGTTNIPVDGTLAGQYQTVDVNLQAIDIDAIYGGQLLWSPPIEGLRLGFSYRTLDNLNADAVIPPFIFGPSAIPLGVTFDTYDFFLGSIEYVAGDLTLQSEYQRVRSINSYETSIPVPSAEQESEGWYLLASYRVHPRVEVGAVVALYSADYDKGKGEGNDQNLYQNDYGVFAGANLTDWWTLKAEYHYVEGAALLDAQNRQAGYFISTTPTSTEYWSYFVARTTVSF